jgi:uncharacterized protein (TIGR02466 family)
MREPVTLFRADLFSYANVGTPDQRQELIDYLLALKASGARDINEVSNNEGCWRYSYPVKDCQWLNEALSVIMNDAFAYYANQPGSKIRLPSEENPLKIGSWCNINEKYARNVYHAHKGSIFSCVYYLQATDTGRLVLSNPANILNDCNNFSPYARDFFFLPKDGDLVLWPSWIPHEVEPNMSDRQRINIVFDIDVPYVYKPE